MIRPAFGLLLVASWPVLAAQIGNRTYDLVSHCFSGKVMLDDGSPGADASVICQCRSARPVSSVATERDGRFVACVERRRSWVSLGECACSVTLAAYGPVEVNAGMVSATESPNLGTIVLHRLAATPSGTVNAASLAIPNEARQAFEKGATARRRGNWKAAERELAKAVKLHPEYAEAWHELGLAYRAQKRPEDAWRAFQHALSADPNYLPPHFAVAALHLERREWKELAAIAEHVIEIDPKGHPLAYLHQAIALSHLGKLDAAENSARRVLELDKEQRLTAVHVVLGLTLAARGDNAGAAEQFRKYLEQAPDAPDAEAVRGYLRKAELRGRE
jgi:tetratricopeptide (TPR) repeat protein